MTNQDFIVKAFTNDELQNGVWNNWDGRGNILTKKFVHLISEKIDFNNVKTILDIGARDGLQSLEFNRWFPDAKIFTFEPISSSYEFTKKITSDIQNISVLPYAINSFDGKTKFYEVYNGNVGASSLLKTTSHYRSRQWLQKEIEVDCINLSNWLETKKIEKVDLIWMDVQGAENIVLESLGKFLKNVDAIATEVGIDKLYENSIMKESLDEYLSDFICLDATPEPSMTEMDVIYLNKKYI